MTAPSPPSPPPSPPEPPLAPPPPSPPPPSPYPPGTTVVGPDDDLIAALNSGDAHIVLRAGVYSLTSNMCSDGRLCLTSTHNGIRIEAEVPGTVVLDAQRGNGVLYISGTGVELVGLNITGGYKSGVRSPDSNQPRARFLKHSARFSGPYPSPR